MRGIHYFHIVKRFGVSLVIALVAAGFTGVVHADNVSFQTARDCNANAIINCGSLNVGQLTSAYNANPYAQKVYSYFGISSSDIKNLPSTARAGHVDKNGNVYLNGRSATVATSAITAGRQNTSGSKAVKSEGVTFYTRPLSAAITTNSADAYVVMSKDGFDYAIIASCDNPVVASIAKPAKPKQPPVTAPAVPAKPTAPTTPQGTLVNTGPISGSAIVLFVTAIIAGTATSYYYQLRKLQRTN
jgi:hypothetical protein